MEPQQKDEAQRAVCVANYAVEQVARPGALEQCEVPRGESETGFARGLHVSCATAEKHGLSERPSCVVEESVEGFFGTVQCNSLRTFEVAIGDAAQAIAAHEVHAVSRDESTQLRKDPRHQYAGWQSQRTRVSKSGHVLGMLSQVRPPKARSCNTRAGRNGLPKQTAVERAVPLPGEGFEAGR